MRAAQNIGRGIWLMVAVTIIFAIQDGISRHLSGTYNVYMVVTIRYWFFALFTLAVAARSAGGLRAALSTQQPLLQTIRALLLVFEIVIVIQAFVHLGLIETHAVFAAYPLLVAALSGPVLGETVGWRRWTAIGIGFAGILIILQPGYGVFRPEAVIPLLGAFLFALYSLLTRFAARKDAASVSFYWTGLIGALAMTPLGLIFWQPMIATDWLWMGALCLTAVTAHFLLIQAYEIAEASAIQPFAYLQLVWVSGIGIWAFGDILRPNVALGAAVVVCAGLFTLWRARARAETP
ncbi:DMT family transporter [Rhodobacter capsulatus]|uniref:DMT family transporter n=1 Tax=Rhodobacter capsulatus TaxID=1061 RepID=UPI0003D36009|nr:DMT family transporter [Rhodobacter capsulatus]ETD86077.1 RhaT family transporter [Rhodobacter capsulatus YW1]ETD88288.1 RhaT family transporter [Rhodobacter capsulatus YW2]